MDRGKKRFHRPGSPVLNLLDHFREFVNIVRAENEIEMRHSLEQSLAFLLSQAATDADDHSFALLFELLPAP